MNKIYFVLGLMLFMYGCDDNAVVVEDSVDEIIGGEMGEIDSGEVAECTGHAECESGVCDHYKADMGICAEMPCIAGETADNNGFYCNNEGGWEATKQEGEECTDDIECYRPTSFMNPMFEFSEASRSAVSCSEGVCKWEIVEDACEQQGLKRVLDKEYYSEMEDGTCIESMAQMVLPTYCVPCGNGTCDEGESKCNCPEDCTE